MLLLGGNRTLCFSSHNIDQILALDGILSVLSEGKVDVTISFIIRSVVYRDGSSITGFTGGIAQTTIVCEVYHICYDRFLRGPAQENNLFVLLGGRRSIQFPKNNSSP